MPSALPPLVSGQHISCSSGHHLRPDIPAPSPDKMTVWRRDKLSQSCRDRSSVCPRSHYSS